MVGEALLPLHKSGFNPQSLITEEAATKASLSQKVLAGVSGLALPDAGRAHARRRAGVRVLQVTQSSKEVAPLEAAAGLRELVLIGRIQTELNEGAHAVHEAPTRGELEDLDGPELHAGETARLIKKGSPRERSHLAKNDPEELRASLTDVAAPCGVG